MLDSFLSGQPKPVGVSDLVVKSAADGKPVKVVRVEVARGAERSVLACTPGEQAELEKRLAADPQVDHWTVAEQTVTFDKGGEGS